MRATSIVRFVILGAVGFGLAGAIGAYWFPLGLLLGGALGGALLGLAFKDLGLVVRLAVLAPMGLIVGLVAGLSLGFLSANFLGLDSEALTGALLVATLGAVLGASLGLAFGDWRTVVALAVTGAVAWSVWSWTFDFDLLSHFIPILSQLGEGA